MVLLFVKAVVLLPLAFQVCGFWEMRVAPVEYRQEKYENAKVCGFWEMRVAPVEYRQEKYENAKSCTASFSPPAARKTLSVSLETGERDRDAASVPMGTWQRGSDSSGVAIGAARSHLP
ncbi:hypothetical protein NDU88_004148 [Pleurodeles waltl]|uniref:Uncharacterized protein n=1 Tax=Pleurodeles waltl TaxID=8319 RepID=A0AAV7T8B2_PLEWA|nr:hypothetical protein NDU88_004148 [Pleurodeles waltl]